MKYNIWYLVLSLFSEYMLFKLLYVSQVKFSLIQIEKGENLPNKFISCLFFVVKKPLKIEHLYCLAFCIL